MVLQKAYITKDSEAQDQCIITFDHPKEPERVRIHQFESHKYRRVKEELSLL